MFYKSLLTSLDNIISLCKDKKKLKKELHMLYLKQIDKRGVIAFIIIDIVYKFNLYYNIKDFYKPKYKFSPSCHFQYKPLSAYSFYASNFWQKYLKNIKTLRLSEDNILKLLKSGVGEIQDVKDYPPSLLHNLLKFNPSMLSRVKNQTEEDIIIATQSDKEFGRCLRDAQFQNENIAIQAVRSSIDHLRDIKDQTPNVIWEALRKDPVAIVYVREQNIEQCLFAIDYYLKFKNMEDSGLSEEDAWRKSIALKIHNHIKIVGSNSLEECHQNLLSKKAMIELLSA